MNAFIRYPLCHHLVEKMIAAPASTALSPAASFFRSSGDPCLPRKQLTSGKIPSSFMRFSSPSFPPKGLFKLQVRAARAESNIASLGSRAPYFELPEPLTGKVWKLDDFESYPALLVMFICNHCPFVKHLRNDIVKLTNFYTKKGLAAVAISSNSILTHPEDGPKFMAEEAKLLDYPFPYLFDESQDVARAFGAVCTPEFFLYRKQDGRRAFELFYHGQFDDSRPNGNVPVTGRDLSLAIDCVLSSQQLMSVQKPSVGCSIKWHPEKRQ